MALRLPNALIGFGPYFQARRAASTGIAQDHRARIPVNRGQLPRASRTAMKTAFACATRTCHAHRAKRDAGSFGNATHRGGSA